MSTKTLVMTDELFNTALAKQDSKFQSADINILGKTLTPRLFLKGAVHPPALSRSVQGVLPGGSGEGAVGQTGAEVLVEESARLPAVSTSNSSPMSGLFNTTGMVPRLIVMKWELLYTNVAAPMDLRTVGHLCCCRCRSCPVTLAGTEGRIIVICLYLRFLDEL